MIGVATLNKLCVDQIDVQDMRVLIRVDFNVSIQDGVITNNQCVIAALPTIKYVVEKGAKSVILLSHLGKPEGKRVETLSLKLVAEELKKLMAKEILFIPDCVGPDVERACENAVTGSIVLLENLRFHIEEEGAVESPCGLTITADPQDMFAFQAAISRLGDIYINEAFGTSHRAYSSVVGVNLPVRAAGFGMKKELTYLSRVAGTPERPFLAILGGKNVVDKVPLLQAIFEKANEVIICGALAFTFLKVLRDVKIGNSLFDEQGAEIVLYFMKKAEEKAITVTLPVDFVTGDKMDEKATVGSARVEDGVPLECTGLDIGPQSVKLFSDFLVKSKTIIWHGPPGVFEWENFSKGTQGIINACIQATKTGATVVIGGGDTAAAVAKWKAEDKVSHVSTGGEASLKLMEGAVLPGVEFLDSECPVVHTVSG